MSDTHGMSRPFHPGSEVVLAARQPRSGTADRWLARRLLWAMGSPPVRIRLWDGEEIGAPVGLSSATVRIGDRRTLYRLLFRSELEFGEAYADGRIELEGDLVRFLESALQPSERRLRRSLQWPFLHANTLHGSRQNIHHHYDLGNEFYRLWLDERMVYTCAYFPHPDASLEEAQLAKMDHVCRKLRLRAGEHVVEAGCGWGALAVHMAKRYGVTVRAFNISRRQVEFAREQVKKEGLAGRVELIEDDYRNVSGRYDAFVSVGMLEHVGTENYRRLGRIIDRCLVENGRGLIHTIGRHRPMQLNAWVERYIFPGGRPPAISEMTEIFEPFGMAVLDLENLRLHYARTGEHWLERFERAAPKVERMFDAGFVRAWRLYLSGVVAGFRSGLMQLFQVTFARNRNNEIPWTRADLYRAQVSEPAT